MSTKVTNVISKAESVYQLIAFGSEEGEVGTWHLRPNPKSLTVGESRLWPMVNVLESILEWT